MDTGKSRTPWLAVAAICLAVAGLYWFIDSRSTLWDRDEPRFSRATAEMIESGNYLYPTFNGQLRPDKPILIYWLMSVPMRLLGPTALACRFWSSLGIAVTCLLTFLLARRLLGGGAGLWSMLILASTVLILFEGTAATADGILLPCMVAVMVIFSSVLEAPWRWYHVAGLGLALGLGLLAKGPVALLPVAVIALTLWVLRRRDLRVRPHARPLAGATVIGILLFLAWALPANQATGGEFLRQGVGHHVLARAATPLEGHGSHFLLHLPYYLPVIIAGFFPWTLHLPGAISALLGRRVGGPHFRTLFLVWVVSIVVIMTLVVTKLPHYILFTWPALALAVGGTLAAAAQGRLAEIDRNWLRGGIYFFGPVAGLAVLGFLAAPLYLHLSGALLPFWTAAALLLAMSLLAMRQQLQNRPRASAITLLAGMFALLLTVGIGVLPALEATKIAPPLAQTLRRQIPPEVPVLTFDFDEPSLYFYLGRQVNTLAGSEDGLLWWVEQPQPWALVITKAAWANIEQRYGALDFTPLASTQGRNYANGKSVEVVALLHRGGNP